MLSLDYKQNFERYHDKLNAEHVTLVADEAGEEFRDFLIRIHLITHTFQNSADKEVPETSFMFTIPGLSVR